MKFEYRLQLKDLVEANRIHSQKASLISYFCLILIFLLVPLISFWSQGDISWNRIFLEVILPNAIIFTLFYGLIHAIQYFSIKRNFENQPSFRNEISVETTEEGLQINTVTSESKIKWSVYTHWKENSNLFLVYQAPNLFNLFPKRAFASDRQVDEFREILASRLPKK